MRLPDPDTSRALLLGCGTYTDPSLPALPSVRGNLTGMKEALTSPGGTGLTDGHCVVLNEAEHTPAGIGGHLTALAGEAEDMLLVYYAGHGLIGPNDELFLALPDTRGDRDLVSWTALPFRLVSEALAGARARNRIIILDCCFSGLAIGAMSGTEAGVESAVSLQLKVAGTCTLASSPANRTSSAPPGEQYTAYTGELLSLLSDGAPGQPELLTLTAIHDHLARALPARGLPAPAQRNTETIGQLALARNKQWTPDGPRRDGRLSLEDDRPGPVPPMPDPIRRRRRLVAGAGIVLVALAASLTAVLWPDGTDQHQANQHKTVVATIHVGSQPQALAVEPTTHALCVANSGDDTVSIIDTTTNKIATAGSANSPVISGKGTASAGSNPASVAVNSHTAYTANTNDNSVSLIAVDTSALVKTIAVGKDPDAIAVNPDDHTAYVANATSDSVSVLSLSTGTIGARVTDSIPVGRKPFAVTIVPTAHTAYIVNKNAGTVSSINTKTDRVTSTIPVGKDPDAIAVDPGDNLAYIANHGDRTVSVVTTTGARKVTRTIHVGAAPSSIALDPTRHTAYVTDETHGQSSDTVTVINTETSQVAGTVTVGLDPKAVAVDPNTHTAYVANSGDDTVSVIKQKGPGTSP